MAGASPRSPASAHGFEVALDLQGINAHTHTLEITLRFGVGRVPPGIKPLGAMMAVVDTCIRMMQPWL